MSQRLLRIVTLASGSGKYGGPYDTACRQIRVAQADGWHAKLLAGTLAGDAPAVVRVPTVFADVRHLFKSPGFTSLGSWSIVKQMWSEIGETDVVHVSVAREIIPVMALFFGIARGKRVVAQPHGMLTSRRSALHRAVDVIMKPLLRRAAIIIALTEQEAQQLRKWSGALPPMSVFGNPLPDGPEPLVRFSPRRHEALFIARMHSRKRVDVFAEAGVMAKNAGWAEKYVAFGPDEGELATLQSAMEQAPEVIEYGGTLTADQVTERVRDSGVFVLSSANEPWGNVLVTALGAGVPVVISASAALAGLVAEYRAGTVVRDGNPRELASAVHELLTAEGEYERCSRGAVNLARAELSPEQQRIKLNKIYNGIAVGVTR